MVVKEKIKLSLYRSGQKLEGYRRLMLPHFKTIDA
jgi:hypothetical protein